jgi:hypothetical protein
MDKGQGDYASGGHTTSNKPMKPRLIRNSKPSKTVYTTEQQIEYVQSQLALLIRREREKAAEARDLAHRCDCHRQHASRALTEFTRLVKKKALQ